jgi:pimeloyl-ACP methyl ester carboxylesterase
MFKREEAWLPGGPRLGRRGLRRRRLLDENSPGPLPRDIPVFLAQGSADGLVRPSVTEAYRTRLCRNGSRVEFVLLPGVGHAFIARDLAGEAIAWMADRFAGLPAPTNCAASP